MPSDKRHTTGLLGLPVPNSSDDSDYVPEEEQERNRRSPKPRGPPPPPPPAVLSPEFQYSVQESIG